MFHVEQKFCAFSRWVFKNQCSTWNIFTNLSCKMENISLSKCKGERVLKDLL